MLGISMTINDTKALATATDGLHADIVSSEYIDLSDKARGLGHVWRSPLSNVTVRALACGSCF